MKKLLSNQKLKRKRAVWIVLGVLILILTFPSVVNLYLKNKIPELINKKTPYQVSLKNFEFSLLKGNISANSISITTKNADDPTVTKISGTVKTLIVEDFGIWNAVFNTSYQAENIKLIDPDLHIISGRSKKKKDSAKIRNVFAIENILVSNGNISVKESSGKDLFKGKHINMELNEIRLSKDISKIPIAFKDFRIDAHDVKAKINDFYSISANSINATKKRVEILSFHLKPIESPALYNAKNVFDLKVGHLSAENLIVDRDSLIIDNAKLIKPQLVVISTNKKTVKENSKEINLKIGIKDLDFRQGSVIVQKKDKVKTASVNNFRLNLKDIVFDKNTVKERIPFAFSTHNVELNDIYFKVSALQAFNIKEISSHNADIFIQDAQYLAIGKSSTKDAFNINTEKIEILNNTSKFVGQQLQLKMDKINVYSPDIKIIAAARKKAIAEKMRNLPPDLIVDVGALNLINGTFSQRKQGVNKMNVKNFNVKLNSVTTNRNMLQESIPFHVRSHLITARALDIDAGKYYRVKVDQIKNCGKDTHISNLAFLPKYSRNQFNKMIPVEEDLYTIKAKSVYVKDHNSAIGDKTAIDLERIAIEGLSCNIYHDLAPPDDNSIRYMFSKKLRDIKFPLYVKQIDINNSTLSYEEVAEKSQIPGKIIFDNFNAMVKDVNSAKIKGRPTWVKVDADFKFFGEALTNVHWQFDVADRNDNYAINGTIKDLSVDNANLFVRPYLNVTLDGQIHYLKFDYKGNSQKIGGNFYFKYNNMHVNFMNKETGKERKLLTAVANIFVKDDSKGEQNYMKVEKKRDPNKSFFNLLWQGIMEGLKKYLI